LSDLRGLSYDGPLVWIEATVAIAMTAEASRVFPRETGGLLIGYNDERSSESVVCACVGPGPRAIHGRSHFMPDHAHHERETARLYVDSGRTWSYLGDWHSHPCGPASLSRKDRRTLARIARSAEARAPRPLMVLLVGAPAGAHCPGQLDTGAPESRDSPRSGARLDGWHFMAWQLSKVPSRMDATVGRVVPTLAHARVFDQRNLSSQDLP
jgi:integrative and conjugative element protein (TIGR02256 family)